METLEKLQSRIGTTGDLKGIVRTMKALAAVSIRQYERATESLSGYSQAIELGFQMLVQCYPEILSSARPGSRGRTAALVLGSDQGMCGALNERVSRFAWETLRPLRIEAVLGVGGQVSSRLRHRGWEITRELRAPGSVSGITPLVLRILRQVESWQRHRGVDHVVLIHARHVSRSAYEPQAIQILPIDEDWLRRFRQGRGTAARASCLPEVTMEPGDLFSALLRQYWFISVYRGLAESLASENASRLASMRRAEQNIEDRLGELKQSYHQQRQTGVTEELLDIVGAYEVLEKPGGANPAGF